jgi:hypothetical protein
MEIVAMIAFANIMGNIPSAMGVFPRNGTMLCTYQGFSITYFFPVSWMFTVILAYLLRGLAYTGRLRLLRHHIHVICWGLPLLFAVLRMSTNTYGVESNLEYHSVCTYGGHNTEAGFLWEAITFCGLLLFACALMIFWLAEIRYLQKQKSTMATSATFVIAKETLFWYPVLLIVCWLPYSMFIIDKGPNASVKEQTNFEIVLRSLKNLCGAFTATVFFWKCKEAQIRWWKLLLPLFCPKWAAAEIDAAAARKSMAGPGATADFEWEEEYEEEFISTDEVMQTRIMSTNLDPAKLAAALEAQGALDAADGALGAATTNILHPNKGCAGTDLQFAVVKKTNEFSSAASTPATSIGSSQESISSVEVIAALPCIAEV